MKNVFMCLAIIGIIIISFFSFVIPSDPYIILPTMSLVGFDKPLWFAMMIIVGFFYLILISMVYYKIKEK